MRTVVVSLLLSLVIACDGSLVHPPFDLERLTPSPFYRRMYRLAEDCTGLEGDFGAVRWFVSDDLQYSGLFRRPHTIIIRRDYLGIGSLIKHESIHHVLELHGISEHRGHEHWAFHECVR